jgi:hypothetical protein
VVAVAVQVALVQLMEPVLLVQQIKGLPAVGVQAGVLVVLVELGLIRVLPELVFKEPGAVVVVVASLEDLPQVVAGMVHKEVVTVQLVQQTQAVAVAELFIVAQVVQVVQV